MATIDELTSARKRTQRLNLGQGCKISWFVFNSPKSSSMRAISTGRSKSPYWDTLQDTQTESIAPFCTAFCTATLLKPVPQVRCCHTKHPSQCNTSQRGHTSKPHAIQRYIMSRDDFQGVVFVMISEWKPCSFIIRNGSKSTNKLIV